MMPQIRPISELRNTTKISELCHECAEPIFMTKNGYGDLVVMSVETYENLLEVNEIDRKISNAEERFAKTVVSIEAHDAFSQLRRKHFEEV